VRLREISVLPGESVPILRLIAYLRGVTLPPRKLPSAEDPELPLPPRQRAGRSVPVALVMLKAKVDKPEAVRRLAKSDGNVRLAIEDNVLEL